MEKEEVGERNEGREKGRNVENKRKDGFHSHSHSLARGSVSQKTTFPKLLCSLDSWPEGGPKSRYPR